MRAAIPAWLRNKYLLTTILFVCWMLFFDHNDLFTQVARSRELSDLKTGLVQAIPGEEVFEEIWKRYP